MKKQLLFPEEERRGRRGASLSLLLPAHFTLSLSLVRCEHFHTKRDRETGEVCFEKRAAAWPAFSKIEFLECLKYFRASRRALPHAY